MTIEQLIPEIVKTLKALPDPPWYVSGDNAGDTEHRESGLALVDTGRTQDWPIARLCEWPTAEFIASSPLWLAQMVVGMVHLQTQIEAEAHEKLQPDCKYSGPCAQGGHPHGYFRGKAVSMLGLTAEDYEWLKGKVNHNANSASNWQ